MTASFRRALGQRFNPGGILFTASVGLGQPHLFLPHLSVRDMRSLDWAALRRVGIRGVVLDKDNTLTAPYSHSLWPPLADALRECVEAFPGQVAVFSNSAGLREYDPDGSEARSLEESIEGIRVIRDKETGWISSRDREVLWLFDLSACYGWRPLFY